MEVETRTSNVKQLLSLEEWLAWISALHPTTIDLSLERVKKVSHSLGHTPFQCPVITVGGTNGKGSCVAFLSAIYRKAGYLVGTYTSPHLLRFNERISIDHRFVEDEQLCQAFQKVKACLGETKLTFFEFTTLAAFQIFSETSLDVLILEVGMGGRLDAVNVIEHDLSIITTVNLDHMEFLGHSREAIGFEKAGILRSNQKAVCGDPDPPQSLLQHAKNIGVSLCCQGRDFHCMLSKNSWNWAWDPPHRILNHLPLPHLPIQNASTSLMAVHLLQNRLPVSENNIREGISEACIAGRYQIIRTSPRCIVDVAHNPEAARYLCQRLTKEPCSGLTFAILGMRRDKAISDVILEMQPIVDEWHGATLDVPNGATSEELAARMPSRDIIYHGHPDPEAAFSFLLMRAEPHDRIVIFGSFHTVQAILGSHAHTNR